MAYGPRLARPVSVKHGAMARLGAGPMREKAVRRIWAAGGAVLNGWSPVPRGFAAELMAHLGWDSLVIDAQHGLVGYQDMVAMLQGISTTAVTPMVRVPWNDPASIMK